MKKVLIFLILFLFTSCFASNLELEALFNNEEYILVISKANKKIINEGLDKDTLYFKGMSEYYTNNNDYIKTLYLYTLLYPNTNDTKLNQCIEIINAI